jgi:hypothetical protein
VFIYKLFSEILTENSQINYTGLEMDYMPSSSFKIKIEANKIMFAQDESEAFTILFNKLNIPKKYQEKILALRDSSDEFDDYILNDTILNIYQRDQKMENTLDVLKKYLKIKSASNIIITKYDKSYIKIRLIIFSLLADCRAILFKTTRKILLTNNTSLKTLSSIELV